MRRPRLSSTGIESYVAGYQYVVMRPTGRCGGRSFGHPFRAAEHAMRAYKFSSWTPLHERGFTVRAFRATGSQA